MMFARPLPREPRRRGNLSVSTGFCCIERNRLHYLRGVRGSAAILLFVFHAAEVLMYATTPRLFIGFPLAQFVRLALMSQEHPRGKSGNSTVLNRARIPRFPP